MIGSDLETESHAATKNIRQMENPGSNSKVNVIIETGGGSNNNKVDGIRSIDFTKVQRHKVLHNGIQLLGDLGQKDMGNPNTLSDFIIWGVTNFPAKKYAIILWDHGSGLNGFGRDIIFKNDTLTPIELKQAFQTAKAHTNVTFELIGFDACAMSSLEVASRLQNATHYMVSSEEVEPLWGWNYTAIIQNLSANTGQSGSTLGKAIVDSYSKQSKYFSTLERFGAAKEVTLALIDMTKIPQLTQDVNALSGALISKIYDLPSAISLSKSIDLTEHYAQSARGGSGLVDLYDLLLNIQARYPILSENIKGVQASLKTAIVYKFSGEARPNANGLSVYMPLQKNEFSNSTELFTIGLDWLKLIYSQRYMISSDKQPPIIKSIREGDNIKANVYGSDIASIYAQIVTNSSKGQNLMYRQSIEPSLIDDHGYFQYNQHKLLVLCNETKCMPTSMKLEVNRDKRFAFIPVRLESSTGNFSKDVSLVYEISKDGKFTFLGATPDIDPQKAIPKAMFSLMTNDKIFFNALPARAQPAGNINGQSLSTFPFFEDKKAPLLVSNPERIEPRYVTLPFSISFFICDYSDNCDKTRWYSFSNGQKLPLLPHGLEFGYDVVSKNSTSITGTKFNTYVNPTFGFKLQYPSDWIEQRQNIYDNSSSGEDLLADPMLVNFYPPKPFSSAGNLPTSLTITVNDWPFKQSPKYYFDFLNKTRNQKDVLAGNVEIMSSNNTLIAGNPSFKFIFKYTSIPEQALHIVKEERMEEPTTVLMNNRMYTINFASYSSQFYHYLPMVEKIINSFGPYVNYNSNTNPNIGIYSHGNSFNNPIKNAASNNTSSKVKEESNLTQSIVNNNNTIFLTYTDPNYGYKIKYPFYPGVGEPTSLKDANPNLRGELFALNDNSAKSADTSNTANLIVTSFLKNETYPIRQNPVIILDRSGLRTFDINGVISNVNTRLSFLKSVFINFAVLNKSEISFKNHPAYSVEYSYFNPIYKSPMQEKVIFTIIADRLFVFDYATKPSNYYTYMPTFQKVINSFELDAQTSMPKG
jgi:hypothetical protein